MKPTQRLISLTILGALVLGLTALLSIELVGAAPASADKKPSAQRAAKDETVDKFLVGCLTSRAKTSNCDTLRKDALEILKEDVLRLGSTANPAYLPNIIRMFYSDDVELRITAAHAIGMIGPQDSDVKSLLRLPTIRCRMSGMRCPTCSPTGRGMPLTLLKQRTMPMRNGRTPEKPSDAAKFSMQVAPDSVYLFDSSDATKGRLSYVVTRKRRPCFIF